MQENTTHNRVRMTNSKELHMWSVPTARYAPFLYHPLIYETFLTLFRSMYAEEYKKSHQHYWRVRIVWRGKIDKETQKVRQFHCPHACFHSKMPQTYKKMCKVKKTETTRNNAVTSARESGAVGLRQMFPGTPNSSCRSSFIDLY